MALTLPTGRGKSRSRSESLNSYIIVTQESVLQQFYDSTSRLLFVETQLWGAWYSYIPTVSSEPRDHQRSDAAAGELCILSGLSGPTRT